MESSLWRIGKRTDKNAVVLIGSVSCPVEDADHEHTMTIVCPAAFSTTIFSNLG